MGLTLKDIIFGLLNLLAILGVGRWAVLNFISFKDEVVKHMGQVEKELALLNQTVGTSAADGLRNEVKMLRSRMHSIAGAVMTLQERQVRFMEWCQALGDKADVPFRRAGDERWFTREELQGE